MQKGIYEWTLDHHEKFKDLEASCEAGCPLCQTLFLLLTYDGLGSVESDPLHWELHFDGDMDLWRFKFQTQKPEDIPMQYIFDVRGHMLSQAIATVKGIITDRLFNTNTDQVP